MLAGDMEAINQDRVGLMGRGPYRWQEMAQGVLKMESE